MQMISKHSCFWWMPENSDYGPHDAEFIKSYALRTFIIYITHQNSFKREMMYPIALKIRKEFHT